MAMRWMYEGAIDPAALRFILLMRDPLERTYSNWLMFRQVRGLDHQPGLHAWACMRGCKECRAMSPWACMKPLALQGVQCCCQRLSDSAVPTFADW